MDWNIAGHENLKKILEAQIVSGSLSHAYLLSGPAHTGKYTLLKHFALALQCSHQGCGECSTCREIENGYHADTKELADDGESLKIDTIREVLAWLASTTTSRYKILILQGIDRLTVEGANALLKSLEEPNPKVIFLLTTNHLHQVLPTILSRVRHYQTFPLSSEAMETLVRKEAPFVDEHKLSFILRVAFGRPGLGLQLLRDENLYGTYFAMYEEAAAFAETFSLSDKFEYIAQLLKREKTEAEGQQKNVSHAKERDINLRRFPQGISLFLEMLLLSLKASLHRKQTSDRLFHIVRSIEKTEESRQLLEQNINKRMTLETLALNI